MTDTEIIIACAKAMGYSSGEGYGHASRCPYPVGIRISEGRKAPRWYSPLYDDAQAMALVKKFKLDVWWPFNGDEWQCAEGGKRPIGNPDLNRAICEAVASMVVAKIDMMNEINRARSGAENDQ